MSNSQWPDHDQQREAQARDPDAHYRNYNNLETE